MPNQLAASEAISQGALVQWTSFPDDDAARRQPTRIQARGTVELAERESSRYQNRPGRTTASGGLGPGRGSRCPCRHPRSAAIGTVVLHQVRSNRRKLECREGPCGGSPFEKFAADAVVVCQRQSQAREVSAGWHGE